MPERPDPYSAEWQKTARSLADWQKAARSEPEWQRTARTDPMKVWTGAPSPSGGPLLLGHQTHTRLPVELDDKIRSQHIYVVGTSGYGKSTLLLNLIRQDIEQGRGFAALDPHGDLAYKILRLIPQNRIADTIYYDPSDTIRPIPLNPLKARTSREHQQVLSNLMVLFQRLFPSSTEAPRLLYILRYAMATLMESGGKTLLDLHRLLTNDDYRSDVVGNLRTPALREYWKPKGQFETRHKKQTDSILNKLGEFDLDPILRKTLGRPESTIDFYDIMQTRKMFVADLSESKLGQENTSLLGAIITSMIQLAALRRGSNLSDGARSLFTLYIDEFQNLIARSGEAFQKIRFEARKNRLGLVLAHQFPSQLPADLQTALTSVETVITFRLGIKDARVLQDAFPSAAEKTIHRLQNLPEHRALVRIGAAQNNFLMDTLPPAELPVSHHRRAIIEYSREGYGVPVTSVKAERTADAAFTDEGTGHDQHQSQPQSAPKPAAQQEGLDPEPPPLEEWE